MTSRSVIDALLIVNGEAMASVAKEAAEGLLVSRHILREGVEFMVKSLEQIAF
jgi:hypothetical protein